MLRAEAEAKAVLTVFPVLLLAAYSLAIFSMLRSSRGLAMALGSTIVIGGAGGGAPGACVCLIAAICQVIPQCSVGKVCRHGLLA